MFHENSDQGSNSYLELIFLQSVRHMELLVFFDDCIKTLSVSPNSQLFIYLKGRKKKL